MKVKHENIIDNYFKHFSKVKSGNSFTYLIDYYLRKGVTNYIGVIINLILQAKHPLEFYVHVMRRFYTEAVFEENYVPYRLLVNSEKLVNSNSEMVSSFYKTSLDFLRDGENLNEIEKKLFDILQNSALKDINDNLD